MSTKVGEFKHREKFENANLFLPANKRGNIRGIIILFIRSNVAFIAVDKKFIVYVVVCTLFSQKFSLFLISSDLPYVL